MRRRLLDRRTFLRGTGGAVLGLPFLEAMLDTNNASGAPGDEPLRVIFFFSNNGTYHPDYRPVGSETDFTFGPILEPLTPYKDRMIVTDGLDMEVSYNGFDPGLPHPWIGCVLSGALMMQNPDTGWAVGGGQTLDQYLGEQIGSETRFSTLEFGVQSQQYTGNAEAHLSYSGPAEPLVRDDDPQSVFDRLFGDFDADPQGVAERKARRQLVIDAVKEDVTSLQSQLGAADNQRLEEHLEAVRTIEMQLLDDSGGVGAACQAPNFNDPVTGSLYTNDLFPEMGRVMTDLLVMSLACDMTRVTTMQWAEALGSHTHTWLGHTEQWHEISHKGDGDTLGNQQKTEVNRWYAERLKYLLDEMAAIPEGEGTLLDNTIVVWVNELAKGNAHNRRDMPFVIVGDGQGYFDTGRYLSYAGDPHNNLLVSVANAMGVDINTFGEAAYCTGPLAGLTG